jgi:hypothetical protein
MNWQFGDSNNNGSNNSGSYENPENELDYLLQKRFSVVYVTKLDSNGLPSEPPEARKVFKHTFKF